MNKNTASVFYVYLLISACALSPQVIDVSPTLQVEMSAAQNKINPITVVVNDSRPSNQLGSRGGVYSDTALLTTNQDMTTEIRAALVGAFESIGFSVSNNLTPTGLNVSILELSYNNQKKTAVNSVTVRAVVKVECRNQQYSMENEYTITDSQDYIKLPSDKENVNIVNSTLSTALNRMFQDEKLFSCLSNQ